MNRMSGNWWFPWDIFVVPQGNGDLKVYQPGRAGDTYVWDAVNQKYVSPPGYFDQMVQNPDGTWTRTTKHGVKWQFNTAGHIVWEQNRWGRQITVNRDAQQKILNVTDWANRATTVNYNGNGYVSSLVDWGGRTISFTYTLQGYLATITYPSTTFYDRTTGQIVTRGKTFTFQYATATGDPKLDGNLLSITDDRANAIHTMTYSPADKVTNIVARGGQWTFQYGSSTTVTDPDGVTTTYSFNASSAIIRKEVFTKTGLGQTPLRQGEPNSYVWLYQRNDPCGCDLITQITRPDGSTISKTYDSWGNITGRTYAPPSGSGLPSRSETWTWAPFNQFSTILTYTSPLGNAQGATPADYTTTWSYDSTGAALSKTLPKATVNGTLTHPVITATYTSFGRPATITWHNGTVYKYDYNATTFDLTQVTRDYAVGGLNLVTQYGYDTYSRLTSVIDPRGNAITYTYNDLDQVTEIQAPAPQSQRARFTYDNLNMVYMIEVENKDANNQQDPNNPWFATTRIYDANNRLVSETREVDATTTATTQYQYTASGRLWKITDPMGNVVEQTYDERGLLFTYTDGVGTAVAGTTTLNYDLNGNLASVVNPRGYTATFTCNSDGWMVGQTDPAGVSAVWTYDLEGYLLDVENFDSQQVRVFRKSYEYDPYGLLLTTNRHLLDAQGATTQTFTTAYEYGTTLQLTKVTDALSNVSTRTYDAVGRVTQVQDAAANKESFGYDANGNLTTHTVQAWNQVSQAYDTLVLEHTYDSQNRRTQTLRRDGGSMMATTRSWAHDSRGNITDATDEVGNTTHYAYDGRSLLTQSTRDLRSGGTGQGQVTGTVVTQTVYDLAGRITSRQDGLNQATTYAYDARNRLTSETNAVSGVRSFTYDANGNVLTVTDPLGSVVTSTYDSRDQLTSRSINRATGVVGTTAESYTFDPLGRRLSAVDDDSTVFYTYDSLGRTLTETEGPNPLGGNGKTFNYGYNALDAMTSITYPDGTVENRGRDAIQRLSTVAVQGGPTLASYQYAGGRVVQLGLQNGVTRANTFDALWHETIVEYMNASQSLRKFEYVFNAADYRLLEKRHHAGGTGDNYGLDSLYRTVQVKEGVADPVLEQQSPGSQTYVTLKAPVYDAAQNRSQVTVTPSGGSPTVTSYTADALNFYTALGGTTHIRDANGNLTDDGTLLYEYDYRNQLCRVKDKATGNLVAEYDYDALGRRTSKATPSASWSYYWSFEAMTMEFDASGQFSRRHFGRQIDEIVGASQRDLADLNNNSSTTDFVWLTPAYDGALDCAAVIGPGATVVESYVYTYDGVVTISNGAGQTVSATTIGWHQGYAGMQGDSDTGLLYSRFRYYSPSIGRWISEDPNDRWHDKGGTGNGFAWVGNAFRNFTDPWGLLRVGIVSAIDSDLEDDHDSWDDAYPGAAVSYKGAGSFGEMAYAITRTCACSGCLDLIVIIAHGSPTSFAMSNTAGGQRVTTTSLAPGGADAAYAAQIGACLCPGGVIILDSCKTAAAGAGGVAQSLSDATGHAVLGNMNSFGDHADDDDFSEGNDDGWVRFNPGTGAGAR